MNPSASRPPSSLSLGAGSSAIDHGRGARRRRFARPPSFAALSPSPSRHNNTLSCSYHLRLTDRASSEMIAHFLSCHSHPSPPSYPRTLTPQAMPVVLRTDPELLTLCHCVLVHLFAARLERQRKPRMSCCTAALLLHVALACPRRPPTLDWARSGLLALLVASSQPSRPGVPCPLV